MSEQAINGQGPGPGPGQGPGPGVPDPVGAAGLAGVAGAADAADGARNAAAFRLGTPPRPVTFREAMDSEFAKIRSVRSTFWTLLICLLLSVGISLLIAAVTSANWNSLSLAAQASTDISSTVAGVYFGVLVTGVLGVLVVASEYSTGMMRTSLTAFPRRGMLFAAKATVLSIVVIVVGLVIGFASYGVASPFYTRHGIDLSLTHEPNLRALFAVAVYLTLVALMGLGLGYLLRHTAAAISALVGLFFVLPIITSFLPGTVGNDLNEAVPSNAGTAMLATHTLSMSGMTRFTPVVGFVTLLIWTAALLVPALLLFRRRDA